MIEHVLRYRDLIYLMTLRDIRIKYKQSFLGILWAILMPVAIVMAGMVVRLLLERLSGRPMEPRELAGIAVRSVPWAFLVSSVRFGTNSLVGNTSLVTKASFPKVIFPLTAVLSQFVDFLIASGVLAVIMAVLRIPVGWGLLWLPFLAALLVVQATGLAILLSAGSVFFRDVKYLVEIVLTYAIFFSPVFFEVSAFGRWKTVLLLNPVAPILEAISYVVTGRGMFDPAWLAYSAGIGVFLLVVAVRIFEKLESYFAECI